ncbi:class I SAM-dependent methyltransferase [Hoyosella subflava]|uniref:Methyltransferase domain protein n=1 Tax=Hoyosella subflava (strain DSM 45089 / JCM 17490 / NBRC 109087 / DQS3-9A1) TaxID=443218 RepID=F6EIX4_HOYSD|nr:class I SAM-dependent methyltransferase [Hoyosella subflava]AEF40035.1 Methyltransferase domain protein [Hoyosella subflava DQS3-9A1]
MSWLRSKDSRRDSVIASPNIWKWPDIYEVENHAQDAGDAIWSELSAIAPWIGRDVVDVGCGTGFHLPRFAETARSVIGVEPHSPLLGHARNRVLEFDHVNVLQGEAARLPLESRSADLLHARTAYFFGPGCEPGIREALRVLRHGGILAIVDLDATAFPYGTWMRDDLPKYQPLLVEDFFRRQGFSLRRVDTRWVFPTRALLDEVLAIEFSPRVAARARRETTGVTLDVRYRIHWLRNTLS